MTEFFGIRFEHNFGDNGMFVKNSVQHNPVCKSDQGVVINSYFVCILKCDKHLKISLFWNATTPTCCIKKVLFFKCT